MSRQLFLADVSVLVASNNGRQEVTSCSFLHQTSVSVNTAVGVGLN